MTDRRETEIRPVDLPEKDWPLRADVSLLGSLVGEMLVEQYGPDLLEQVERIRKAAILRREQDLGRSEGLEEELAELTADEAGLVIHAFSSYMRMVNLAEKVHRIRRRRTYQRNAAAPQRAGLEDVVGELKSSGIELSDLQEAITGLNIQPVFTAHPTEATRRTIQEKEYDIVLRLVDRLNPEITPEEENIALQRILAAMTSSWQTRLVPHVRPTVADELDNILFYITDILYRVIPVFYENLQEILIKTYGPDAALQPDPLVIRFGSWVGGDMDGNPNVNAATIGETLVRQRRVIIERYRSEVNQLARYLSQSVSEVSVSMAVLKRSREYNEALPELQEIIPQRHRDMPYRCLLKAVSKRLDATLHNDEMAYAGADELLVDLALIERSLQENKGEHAGLFSVRRLLLRVRTFGFHLLSLDVRQDALVHRRVLGEWLQDSGWLDRPAADRADILAQRLRDADWPDLPDADAMSSEMQQTLDVFRAIYDGRRQFGETAVGLFIISMTQGADDVLSVLALDRAANPDNGSDITPERSLDIAPLLETVDDLAAGPEIMESLLGMDVYRSHLAVRKDRQVVMVGYSDSSKDSGIVASRWALQQAQQVLVDTGERHQVDLVFFHGRGGTVSRGGGNLVNGILGAPDGSVNGFMRLTEQGEVINRKYGVRPIALRNLELITGATLAHSLRPAKADADVLPPDHAEILTFLAQRSRKKYRDMVYENPAFPRFFRTITPIDVIEQLTIGSRPPSRRSGEGIGNLRAIPWVFSWAQTRIGFPGVFGVGSALDEAVDKFGIDPLRELLGKWLFFRAIIDDVEMVLAKSELGVGRRYAELVAADHQPLYAEIEKEFDRAQRHVLALKQSAELLDDQRTLQRNIRLRNPYVDPMHMLQIDLLRRWRAGDRQDDGLLKALMSTISGISLGIQNTG